MYCLDNDQTHFKTNFTVHIIENNLANRHAQTRRRSENRRGHLFVYGDSADSVGFRFVDNLVLPSGRSICIILFSLLIRPYLANTIVALTAN